MRGEWDDSEKKKGCEEEVESGVSQHKREEFFLECSIGRKEGSIKWTVDGRVQKKTKEVESEKNTSGFTQKRKREVARKKLGRDCEEREVQKRREVKNHEMKRVYFSKKGVTSNTEKKGEGV